MDKKTKAILKDVRNKVEDTIVKAKEIIEKHPVACTIGGAAVSAIIAGAIGKKVGFKDGFDAGLRDEDEWVYKGQPTDKMYMNVGEDSKFMLDKDVQGALVRGACCMHLEEGDGVAVLRRNGELLIDTLITTDDNFMEEMADCFKHVDVNEV